MKRLLIACLSLVVLIGCGHGESQEAGQVPGNVSEETLDVVSAEAIDEDVFSGPAVTMVNFWGTFCPPCIAEMPDLGDLSRELSDEDFRLVGVVLDVTGPENEKGASSAQKIIRDANADFTHVYVNQAIADRYGSPQAVPTTIFLDHQGEVIGKPIVGAASKEQYKAAVLEHLQAEAA